MPEVREEVINVKLAEILSKDFGIDCRAERVKGRRRPDIRCYYKGFIILIESSYSRSDAEEDAKKRVEQEPRLADIALALWIKEKDRFRDLPEAKLEDVVRSAKYSVKIFVPVELRGTLLQFIEKGIKRGAEPATGWFEDVDLPTIRGIIEHSIIFLVREEDIAQLMKGVRTQFDNFIKALNSLDHSGSLRRNIYDTLYKLYGLTVAETQDPDIAFGHAALSILLSAVFYEHIRSAHPNLKHLSDYIYNYGAIEGFRRALEDLLKIDYRPAIELTIEVLRIMPIDAEARVKDLIDLALKIASKKALLRRDFAGRLYHSITGSIAVRKGFATFYTEVPAAYLLAYLAVSTLLNLDERKPMSEVCGKAKEVIEAIRNARVGDFACGSGTLLTASYSALMHIASAIKFYCNVEELDLESLGRELIENGIHGIDALRYASQITAINLALIGPSTISKENAYTIYLGYIPERRQAWLGSLELLRNGGRVGGLLAYIEGSLKGVAERVTIQSSEGVFAIPQQFDLIIMNPPFTRATGRGEEFSEEGRGLFGFMIDENIRQNFLKAYESVREEIRKDLRRIASSSAQYLPDVFRRMVDGTLSEARQYLSIGQAGEGLLFLYLAYRYVKNGGVIAFVLPRNLLAGVSWFLARVLLASKFHVKYVIVSSDADGGYNFSEGAKLSETLIVAKRTNSHSYEEETVFVNLLTKPSTALEAIMLAEEIMKSASKKQEDIVEVGGSRAMVFKISRMQLLNSIDNWNGFVAVPNTELLKSMINLYDKGEIVL
jgi:PAS domain-containing protein